MLLSTHQHRNESTRDHLEVLWTYCEKNKIKSDSLFHKLNHLKMVKRRSPTDVDRYMEEYRMRTPYATPTPTGRSISDQHSARSIHQHDAHSRSHARHNPNEAFYHSEGRIDKNSRNKKTYPEKPAIQTHHYQPVTTTTPKKSSCCTIL